MDEAIAFCNVIIILQGFNGIIRTFFYIIGKPILSYTNRYNLLFLLNICKNISLCSVLNYCMLRIHTQ